MQIAQKNFHKKLFGRIGERKAEKFLKEKGYKILARNYKTKLGEIDLIAQDKDFIVFVEVKTRTSDKFGRPSEAVNQAKQQKIRVVASEYLVKHGLYESLTRFDVVEVENEEINHILDAFGV